MYFCVFYFGKKYSLNVCLFASVLYVLGLNNIKLNMCTPKLFWRTFVKIPLMLNYINLFSNVFIKLKAKFFDILEMVYCFCQLPKIKPKTLNEFKHLWGENMDTFVQNLFLTFFHLF